MNVDNSNGVRMNVDNIYVLSLHKDGARRELMREWYKNASNEFEYFLVSKDSTNPTRGCFGSHVAILKDAKRRGFRRVLIMEDDSFPVEPWSEIVRRTNDALIKLPKDFTYFMLGYLPFRTMKTNFKDIVSVSCCSDTHSYIANIENISIPVWNEKKQVAIDSELFCQGSNDTFFNVPTPSRKTHVFAIKPMVMIQKAPTSNINHVNLWQQSLVDNVGVEELTNLSTDVNLIHLAYMLVILIIGFIFVSISGLAYFLRPNKTTKAAIVGLMGLWSLAFFIISCVMLDDFIKSQN